jgi:membrane protein implicated in regulation of membrane protease activity
MLDNLMNDIVTIWLVCGGLFLVLEVTAISGIGFLFAGLAAITTGGLVQYGLINTDNYTLQTGVFLGCVFLWAGVLWLPMQRFYKKNKSGSFNNMVGDTAIICGGALKKGKIGQVKWSGTIMNARISDNNQLETIEEDSMVTIEAVDGNILIVKKG